jgi:hypothetical protein
VVGTGYRSGSSAFLGEGALRLLGGAEPLQHQPHVVDGVTGLRIERDAGIQGAPGIREAPQLEQDLAFEGAVDGDVAAGLERAAHQEERALEIVEVEDRLGLQIVHLGLGGAIEARKVGLARQQLVAELHRLLELREVLDHQLGAVQVRRDELGIGLQRALEFVERLFDLALVPQDLTAAVVGLGALGMREQRLVEPGERLLGAATVRGLHRLVETVPVAIVVLHGDS